MKGSFLAKEHAQDSNLLIAGHFTKMGTFSGNLPIFIYSSDKR